MKKVTGLQELLVLLLGLAVLAGPALGQVVVFDTYNATAVLVVSYSTPDGSSFQQARYESNATITLAPALNVTASNPSNFTAAAGNESSLFTESNPFYLSAQSVDLNNATANSSGAWAISTAEVKQQRASIAAPGLGSRCRQGGNIQPINCPPNLTCRLDRPSLSNPDAAQLGVCVPSDVSIINIVEQLWSLNCSQTFFTGQLLGPDLSTLLSGFASSYSDALGGFMNRTNMTVPTSMANTTLNQTTDASNYVNLALLGSISNTSVPELYTILSASLVGQAWNGSIWLHVEGKLVAGLSNQAAGALFPLDFSIDLATAPPAAPLPVAPGAMAPVLSANDSQAYPGAVETLYYGTAQVTLTPSINVTSLNQTAVNTTTATFAPNTTTYSMGVVVDVEPTADNSSLTFSIVSPIAFATPVSSSDNCDPDDPLCTDTSDPDNSTSSDDSYTPPGGTGSGMLRGGMGGRKLMQSRNASSPPVNMSGLPASLSGLGGFSGFDSTLVDLLVAIAGTLESFALPPVGFGLDSSEGWNSAFNGSQVTGQLLNETSKNVFAGLASNCTDLGLPFGTLCSQQATVQNLSPGATFTATLLQGFFSLELTGMTVDGALNFAINLGAYAVDPNASCYVPSSSS